MKIGGLKHARRAGPRATAGEFGTYPLIGGPWHSFPICNSRAPLFFLFSATIMANPPPPKKKEFTALLFGVWGAWKARGKIIRVGWAEFQMIWSRETSESPPSICRFRTSNYLEMTIKTIRFVQGPSKTPLSFCSSISLEQNFQTYFTKKRTT